MLIALSACLDPWTVNLYIFMSPCESSSLFLLNSSYVRVLKELLTVAFSSKSEGLHDKEAWNVQTAEPQILWGLNYETSILVLQINESRLFEGTNGMRPEHHLSLSLLWSFLYNKVGHWITTFNHVCMYIGRKNSCFQFVNWFTL